MDLVPFTVHHPGNWQIIAPSFGGKTRLVAEILERRHETFSVPIESIVFVYSEFQPIYYKLMDKIPQIKFTTSIDEAETLVESPGIIVFDDIMDRLSNSENIRKLTSWWTTEGHHRGISCLALLQNAYHKGLRELSLSNHYVVLFRQPRDMNTVSVISRQVCPYQTKFLVEAFRIATDQKEFSYIFLNLHPKDGNYKYFVRSSIWPEKDCVIFAPK